MHLLKISIIYTLQLIAICNILKVNYNAKFCQLVVISLLKLSKGQLTG